MPPQQASPPHDSSTPSQLLDSQQPVPTTSPSGKDSKPGVRKLFGLVKQKKEEEEEQVDQQEMSSAPALAAGGSDMPAPTATPQVEQQHSDLKPGAPPTAAPLSRYPYHPALAASPSRLRSSSPRLQSPASSEIFERNVQEPIPISTLEGEFSPAHIPAHMITEDSIPPALEASAQAITSEELNVDEVEIVTSASHQPAAATLEGSASHADLSSLSSPLQQQQQPPLPATPTLHHSRSEESETASNLHQFGVVPGAEDDGASNYGQLDPTDVRRLSFISFQDIVNSEHQQMAASSLGEIGSRDSLYMGSLSSSVLQEKRAASPLRSPRSPASTHSHSLSGGLRTPPISINVNPLAANPEQSPVRSVGIGSPGSQHQHGELTIETMRQALRKTASGDLGGGGRNVGMSPVGDEQSVKEALRSRTNT